MMAYRYSTHSHSLYPFHCCQVPFGSSEMPATIPDSRKKKKKKKKLMLCPADGKHIRSCSDVPYTFSTAVKCHSGVPKWPHLFQIPEKKRPKKKQKKTEVDVMPR